MCIICYAYYENIVYFFQYDYTTLMSYHSLFIMHKQA